MSRDWKKISSLSSDHQVKHRQTADINRKLSRYALTEHARTRSAQRNLAPADLQYVLEHARIYHVADSVTFFLGRRDIPEADRSDDAVMRLEGTAIVTSTSEESVIITAWRNRNGTKNIRRKLR